MRVKAVVDELYADKLGSYVLTIPSRNEQLGEVIYTGRNIIYHTNENGIDLSIKSFKVPPLFNRIAYTYFRKSKARRSYEYAVELMKLGIDTPAPVAYVETYRHGLLHRSYYVCLMLVGAHDIRHWEQRPDSSKIEEGTAQVMARLHAAGVFHRDFTPGNILYDKDYRFYLIDINRMSLRGVSYKKMLENFNGINEDNAAVRRLALCYASITGIADADHFADEMAASAARWWEHRHRHNFRKSRIKVMKEKLLKFFGR